MRVRSSALRVQNNGAPRAKPVVPCLTPMWGDIAVTRLHIPPRPEAVVSCGRDEKKVFGFELQFASYAMHSVLQALVYYWLTLWKPAALKQE
jgi:hypothetical protein